MKKVNTSKKSPYTCNLWDLICRLGPSGKGYQSFQQRVGNCRI